MRNLKRALSLLLSSTMVLGMLVMGSSAAGYQDVDASNVNQEAIEVLQTVGIMTGDQNGNFNPDGSITRNEMAVVMAHLLNLDYDYYRGTNPFTDVPEWAAPYVAACAAEGVVAGIGNGQYGGNQKVTAAQASLMVMKALGYFQNAEDFGTDWQVATIRQASYINLFDNINANAESALTRAQVAQLVLNGLKAQMVDFTGDKGIQIGDVTVGYNAEYTARTNANKKYNSIDTGKTDIAGNNQYYVQLGEELYNGDLKLADDEADVFGRPAHTWSFDGEKIGTYVNYDLMVEEYTTSVSGKELYDVVGKTAFDKYDFESYVNGEDSDLHEDISKDNKGNVDYTLNRADVDIDNGDLTQVFVNSDKEEVVVTVINTFLAQAISDYNDKKDTATFEIYGMSGENGTVSGEDFDVADIKKDDFVLVTYANDEIQTISDVETLSNVEISKFSTDGTATSVTVDGTKYDDSAKLAYDTEILDLYANSTQNLKDKTYNVYLDQYGYMIGVEEVEGVANYLFITGIDKSSSSLTTKNYAANAIFLDGTSKVIDVKNNDDINNVIDAANAGNFDGTPVINKWFKYTVNSSDVYTLSEIDDKLNSNKQAQSWTAKNKVSEINDKHISLNTTNDGKIYGNDDSVYLLAELDVVNKGAASEYAVIKGAEEVVVGVDNTALTVWGFQKVKDETSVASTDNKNLSYGTYALYDDGNDVIAAVVVGESDSISSQVAYVSSNNASSEGYADGKWTWTRDVIINGEKVELTETNDENESVLVDYDERANGRWVTVKYMADGTVKDIVPFTARDDEYTTSLKDAVTTLRTEDLVIVDIASGIRLDYNLSAKTLWNSQAPNNDNGIRVAADVKVVLTQTNKNKETTDYYEGAEALGAVLEELNEVSNTNKYYFGAVIENGRATSIIIVDDNLDNGYEGPDGSNKDPNVIKLSGQNNNGDPGAKVELKSAVTKNTTYEVELQMMNNDGDWRTVDTVKVLVENGKTYGFTPVTGISANQQYRLVYGELTALLSK